MTNPIVLASAPEFYSWQAQDGTMRVHLNIAAVAQMQADVQSGLKRIPKRGAEVGGILLGSAEQIANVRTITVHHFQSFECEYSTGPSWTLSPRDLSLLEPILHALGRANDAEQRIVGFYRSNTRERLALSTADLDLIGKYFPEDRHIFLLIQPQLGRTASLEFSYWAGGQVCSAPNQLPIRATLGAFATSALPGTVRKSVPPAAEPAVQPAELPVRPAPAEARTESPQQPLTLADTRPAQPEACSEPAQPQPTVHDIQAAEPQAPAEAPRLPAALYCTPPPETSQEIPEAPPAIDDMLLAPPKAKMRRLPSFVYVALGIVTVVIVAVAVLAYQTRRSGLGAAELALQLDRRADQLILSWNPTAPVLQAAYRVTLSIRDGGNEKTVDLNLQQLLAGRLYYAPATRDVKLSMELYQDHDRRVGEAVYFLGDATPAGSAPPDVAPFPTQPRNAEPALRLAPPISAQGAIQAPTVVVQRERPSF